MLKRSRKLQGLQDRRKHCEKDAGKCNGDMERIKDEIAEREVQVQELGQKSQGDLLGRGRVGQRNPKPASRRSKSSCASQSNGCCFDPTMVEQLFT